MWLILVAALVAGCAPHPVYVCSPAVTGEGQAVIACLPWRADSPR